MPEAEPEVVWRKLASQVSSLGSWRYSHLHGLFKETRREGKEVLEVGRPRASADRFRSLSYLAAPGSSEGSIERSKMCWHPKIPIFSPDMLLLLTVHIAFTF